MRTFIFLLAIHLFNSVFGQTDSQPKFSNVKIDSMGDIQWTVTYPDAERFEVHIEKLVNGKWTDLKVGLYGMSLRTEPDSTSDTGTLRTMTHTSRVKFHKGLNIYRLVMIAPDKTVSDEI